MKKITRKELSETLNKLGRRIKRWYPYINNGGCCVYASIVGSELQRRGIDTRIIVGAWNGNEKIDINEARSNLQRPERMEEWNENNVFFNHVGVEIKFKGAIYHHDANGVTKKKKSLDNFRIYQGRLSVAEAKALAANPEGWNDSFDRRSIPKLKQHISKYLAANLPQ